MEEYKTFRALVMGHSTEMSTHKNSQLGIVFESLLRSLSILLLATVGAKLIGPHGGLQVDEKKFVM